MRKELVAAGYDPASVKQMTETVLTDTLAKLKGLDATSLTNYLWDKYHPYNYWILLFSIGMFTVVSLWIYYKILIKK